MALEEHVGANKLANVLNSRINSKARKLQDDLTIDFGIIQSDYSLLTNTYPVKIPNSDYLVCRQLTLGDTDDVLYKTGTKGEHYHDKGGHAQYTGSGEHTHFGGPHEHTTLIPEKMRKLKPGDRVLVAWVQSDPVVIDLVLPASVL